MTVHADDSLPARSVADMPFDRGWYDNPPDKFYIPVERRRRLPSLTELLVLVTAVVTVLLVHTALQA